MSLGNPPSGYNFAAEFTVSPIPWVTSSFLQEGVVESWSFENLTSLIHVENRATGSQVLGVGWSRAGVTGSSPNGLHRLTVLQNQDLTLHVRCKEIFIMPVSGAVNYNLFAGLTGIPSRLVPSLSGSGYGGVG
jgi:hypothetical protein